MLSRKRIILIIAISALLVLSACTMEVHSTFEKDGSGEFSLAFLITKEDLVIAMEQFAGYGVDIEEDEILDYIIESAGYGSVEDLCAGFGSNFSIEGVEPTVVAEEKDGGLNCTITMQFSDIEEFKAMQDIDDLEIVLTEDTFLYRVEVGDMGADLDSLMAYEDYGLDMSVKWLVTTPGKISDHNGTSVSGNTVTWDLLEVAKEGNISHMEVTSSTSGGGGLDITTIIIIAVVVVVVIFFLSQQKKSEEEV